MFKIFKKQILHFLILIKFCSYMNQPGWSRRSEMGSTGGVMMRPRVPPSYRNYPVPPQNPQQVANDIVNMTSQRYSRPPSGPAANMGSRPGAPQANMRRYRLGSPPAYSCQVAPESTNDSPSGAGYQTNHYCSGESTSPISPSSNYSANSNMYSAVQAGYLEGPTSYSVTAPVSSPDTSGMMSPPSLCSVSGTSPHSLHQEVTPHIPSISEEREADTPSSCSRPEEPTVVSPTSYSLPSRASCTATEQTNFLSKATDGNNQENKLSSNMIRAEMRRQPQVKENNPLQSLHKLAMFTNSQVVDPKSVVHDACFSSESVIDGPGKLVVEGAYESNQQKNCSSGSSVENMAGLSLIANSQAHVQLPPPYVHQTRQSALCQFDKPGEIDDGMSDFMSYSPFKLGNDPVILPSELDLDIKIPSIKFEVSTDSDSCLDGGHSSGNNGSTVRKNHKSETPLDSFLPEKIAFGDEKSSTSASDIETGNPLISELLSDNSPLSTNKIKSPDASPLKRESTVSNKFKSKKKKLFSKQEEVPVSQVKNQSSKVDQGLDHQNNNPPKSEQNCKVKNEDSVCSSNSEQSKKDVSKVSFPLSGTDNVPSHETDIEKNKALLLMRRRRRVRNFVTPKDSLAKIEIQDSGGSNCVSSASTDSKHSSGSAQQLSRPVVSGSSQVNKESKSCVDSQLTNLNCLKDRDSSYPHFKPTSHGLSSEDWTGTPALVECRDNIWDGKQQSDSKTVLNSNKTEFGLKEASGIGYSAQTRSIHRNVQSCQQSSDVTATLCENQSLSNANNVELETNFVELPHLNPLFKHELTLLDEDGFCKVSISIGLPDVNGNIITTNHSIQVRQKVNVMGKNVSNPCMKTAEGFFSSSKADEHFYLDKMKPLVLFKKNKKMALMRNFMMSVNSQCTNDLRELTMLEVAPDSEKLPPCNRNRNHATGVECHNELQTYFRLKESNRTLYTNSGSRHYFEKVLKSPAGKKSMCQNNTAFMFTEKINKDYLQRELEKLVDFKVNEYNERMTMLSKPETSIYDLSNNEVVYNKNYLKMLLNMCNLYQGNVGKLPEVIAMPVIEVDVTPVQECSPSMPAANTEVCLNKQGQVRKHFDSTTETEQNGQKDVKIASIVRNGSVDGYSDDDVSDSKPKDCRLNASNERIGEGGNMENNVNCSVDCETTECKSNNDANEDNLAYTVTINDSGSENSKDVSSVYDSKDHLTDITMADIKLKAQTVEIPLEIVSIIKSDEVLCPSSLMSVPDVKIETPEDEIKDERDQNLPSSSKSSPKGSKKKSKKRKRKSEPWEEGSDDEDSLKKLNLSRTLDLFRTGKIKKPRLDMSKSKKSKAKGKDKSKNKNTVMKPVGPVVKIRGPKEFPTSSSVVNVSDFDVDSKARQGKENDRSVIGNQVTFDLDESVPFVCAICGHPSSYEGLGDLFGPYYLQGGSKQHHQPVLKKGENTKQTSKLTSKTTENISSQRDKKCTSKRKRVGQKDSTLKSKQSSGTKNEVEECIVIDLTESDKTTGNTNT